MTNNLFSNIELTDDTKRIASRKCVAVAHKRAEDKFSVFLVSAKSSEDLNSRIALIEDELREVVEDVCAQYDGDVEKVLASVTSAWDDLERSEDGKWSKKSPQDNSKDINDSLEEAPSAVGIGVDDNEVTAAVRESFGPATMPSPVPGMNPYDQQQPVVDPAQVQPGMPPQGNVVPGVVPPVGQAPVGPPPVGSPNGMVPPAVAPPLDPRDPANLAPGLHTGSRWVLAEALETVDLTKGGETPSPKIDKGKAGDQKPVDSEMSGTRHPTEHQDITEPADHKKNFLEGTDAVTEHNVDVTKTRSPEGSGKTKTWSENKGVEPVTSGVDPDKNPIREIMDTNFGGFVPESVIATTRESFSTPNVQETQRAGAPVMITPGPDGIYVDEQGNKFKPLDLPTERGPYDDGSIAPGSGRHWSDPGHGGL